MKISAKIENYGSPVKIVIVVGARPNFMKVAPIIEAIGDHNKKIEHPLFQHLLVHTGQHYDALMSEQFFTDLRLPKPDAYLGAESGSPVVQTAKILTKFEEVLLEEHPDVVVVVGDVNSTLACALATTKSQVSPCTSKPLIAHVEAGLRSFDRTMPEEINRILTDHLSDLLFVTERSGLANLRREGISTKNIHFVGNTMIDSLLSFKSAADSSSILDRLDLLDRHRNKNQARSYGLLTLHRPANVDDRQAFQRILEGISMLSQQFPIIFPVHPRTRKRIQEFGFELDCRGAVASGNGICLVDPLGYLDFLCLMKNARLVLTDSGGIQEETTSLGVPCVTIRENTERPITVRQGTNVIAGTSVNGIRKAIARQLIPSRRPRVPEKWDGLAASRIVAILAKTILK
jgi:UDP-N-acetylglucosamine 2-epimerase (non-hydrolysing)